MQFARTLTLFGFTFLLAYAMPALRPNVGPVIYGWFGVAALFGLVTTLVSLVNKDFRSVSPWLWTTFGFTTFAIVITALFGSTSAIAILEMIAIFVVTVIVALFVCCQHDLLNSPMISHG